MDDRRTAHVFGAPRLSTASAIVDIPRSLQGLLSFLLLNPSRPHRREAVATQFWAERDEHHARRCLNTAIWRLRELVEPEGVARGSHLHTDGATISLLAGARLQIDALLLDSAYAMAQQVAPIDADPTTIKTLESAVLLCSGTPLDGVEGEWVESYCERLVRQQTFVMRYLMTCRREQKDLEGALALGRQLLTIDPYREDIHRDVMGVQIACGDRAGALRQFEQCRTLLAQELGVEPAPETAALYHSIAGRAAGVSWTAGRDTSAEQRRQIDRHLRLAQLSSRRAAYHMEEAKRLEQQRP